MVIQRWQSVFLLLSAIMMGIMAFVPFAVTESGGIYPIDYPFLMVLNLLVAVLLLINIFLYKNLQFQIKLSTINSLLILGSICCSAILTYMPGNDEARFSTSWWFVLPVLAYFLTRLARNRMLADKRLLSAADRLR